MHNPTIIILLLLLIYMHFCNFVLSRSILAKFTLGSALSECIRLIVFRNYGAVALFFYFLAIISVMLIYINLAFLT